MALFAIAFLGTTPLGAPLVRWNGERFGARMAFGFGAVAAIGAALVALAVLARLRERADQAPQALPQIEPEVAPVAIHDVADQSVSA